MGAFDAASLAVKAACGANNELLFDDVNMPSVMVKIPKMTYAQLGLGASAAVHPAFLVNGSEVAAIWISKYQNIVQNGRAYSLPGQDPAVNITFDQVLAACTAKGAGWHLMTRAEWAMLILWCEVNGFIPKGNNTYGKHSTENAYKAIPTYYESGQIARVATGTGPLTWFHDNSPAGIADLCGNVWEWIGGIRTVFGEVQILANNNAADGSRSQGASSAEWKAIDATSGALITPNGTGTTANSVKMDYISSKITYSTAITVKEDVSKSCGFSAIVCDGTIGADAQLLLKALGMLATSGSVLSAAHTCYMNNGQAERSFSCGGYCGSSGYGAASFDGVNPRSNAWSYCGFRAAFVQLPTG